MIVKLINQLVLEPEQDSLTFKPSFGGDLEISWRSQRGGWNGPEHKLSIQCAGTTEGVQRGLENMLEQVNEIEDE